MQAIHSRERAIHAGLKKCAMISFSATSQVLIDMVVADDSASMESTPTVVSYTNGSRL